MRRKDDKGMIELASEDVELIMGENVKFLDDCLTTIFCRQCSPKPTQITNYKVYLNNLEDLIFKGECVVCGSPVARYIETGENPESAGMAKHIREVVKKYKWIKKG